MALRIKILLLLIPLIVAPLLAMGWIAYSELRVVSEHKSFDSMARTVEHFQQYSATALETATSNIALFADHTMVKKYVLTADENNRYTLLQAPLLRAFNSFQQAFPDYYEMRIFLPDGYEDIRLTNRPLENITDEEQNNPIFQGMVRGGDSVYSTVFRNPDNGEIALFVGKPLILRDPSLDPIEKPTSLRGYLAITVDLSDMAAQISETTIGSTGYLLATDGDGRPLFHPENIADEQKLPSTTFTRALAVGATGRPVLVGFNGQSVFAAGTQLLPDLYLFAIHPESDLRRTTLKLALVVSLITLVTTILTTAALFLTLQHFIISPVHKLRNLSRDIGRGRLDIKTSVKSNDEIGELATAIEDMAGNLRRSDERIRFIAYHDALTGLPNRAMFNEYLHQVIADAKRNDRQFALLFLDIDDFKRVNDTLGHQAGDLLLQEVTERLSTCLRQADYVARMDALREPDEILARLGGDEFVVLLPDIHGPHAPSSLSNRLLSALSEPFFIDEHEFFIGASIGITLFPSDGTDADTLTKNADIAMYHAKEGGKNDYQFYLESMNVLAHERLELENKLRKALSNNELSLYYQPQVDTESGEIVGLEALLRWHHPQDGMIPPGVFIPVAEETGLILDLGEWVINEACRQNHAWQQAGLPPTQVSVNVSGHQFGKQDVARLIQTALLRNRLSPRCLEVEITESAIMEQPERAIKELAAIKDLGVGIALDDFGTGYSSFSYLHRFPIDTLKIDRSFIHDMSLKEENSELVAAIIAMAHILKLRVVAEGIETHEQLGILRERECDVIQGFLFKPPVPADEVAPLLRRRTLRMA